MDTQVLDGLAGAAPAIPFRMRDPVHARQLGDGLELLAGEEPLGQVRGDRGRGNGGEAELGVDGEAEVLGQKTDPFCGVSGVLPKAGARREVPGGR
ncbi:hypothetical protein [Streptomyces sp. NPDC017988]|uniref:hypothetical protein n=1 Tax=Streptomyces sp. NPDC017988 TaxID=3365025 RepID=UPI0037B4D9D9